MPDYGAIIECNIERSTLDTDDIILNITKSGSTFDITGWTATVNAFAGLPYTSEVKTMNWYGGGNDFSYEQLKYPHYIFYLLQTF